MTVWSYKISRDFGFAPNPFFGFCTVACCKPGVRKGAKVGDLVIGCGSAALNLEGKMIFGMLVEERLTFNEYWEDSRFQRRKPCFNSGRAQMYGDNIYCKVDDGDWSQMDSHHSLDGGGWNQDNADRDLKTDAVLISKHFSYFGNAAIDIPAHLRNFEGDDLYPHIRDYRNGYSAQMQAAILDWYMALPRGRLGRPNSWK